MKIVIDEQVPFVRGVFESVGARVLYLPGGAIDASAVADADALIVRTRTRCDRRLLAGSRVKVVFSATIGFDHIAVSELADLGVSWYNAPGCNAESVSEYVLACLLQVCDTWRGRTLGVIGVGHVGRRSKC